jgi:hypothetical protein
MAGICQVYLGQDDLKEVEVVDIKPDLNQKMRPAWMQGAFFVDYLLSC